MITAELLTLARKVTNYEIDATGGGTHWIDTTHYRATCPVGKRWKVLGGYCGRAVNATANGYIRNVGDAPLQHMVTQAAAASGFAIPTVAIGTDLTNLYMDAEEYFEVVFGVAQNAATDCSFQVLEIDI